MGARFSRLRRWAQVSAIASVAVLTGTADTHGEQAGNETPRERYAMVNGIRLHYADWGGEGETVLCCRMEATSYVTSAPSLPDSRTDSTCWA